MKNFIKILIFSLFAINTFAQQATEIDSKSVKLPRYASPAAVTGAIPTPTQGMLIYRTDTKSNWYYDGTDWKDMVSIVPVPLNLTNSGATTFSSINSGTIGYAANFENGDPTNNNPTINVVSKGSGNAARIYIENLSNSTSALSLITLGSGKALNAINNSLTSPTAKLANTNFNGLALETSGGLKFGSPNVGTPAAGKVLTAIDNQGNTEWQDIPSVISPLTLTSSSSTFTSIANGTSGFAGRFQSNDLTNSDASVYSTSHGTGDAFKGIQYNAGNAASLVVSNNSSNYSAVYGESNGIGKTSWFKMRGTGKSGYFQIDNPLNSNTTIEATTNGIGSAGEFSNTNATASAPVLDVKNQGSGYGINIESQNAISADGFIKNKGFTQLGELSPKIKTVDLNGYIGAGSVLFIPHNLDANKILSINVNASLETGLPPYLRIPPSFISLGNEYFYDYYFDDTKIYFIIPSTSTKVKNFYARVLISYKE